MVHETICLLEVIYKVEKKLGICPLKTFLLSKQRRTRRAFAGFFHCLLSSPYTCLPDVHMDTRAHLHPLFKLESKILSMLEEVTSGKKPAELYQRDEQNPGTAHAPFPSEQRAHCWRQVCARFVAWDLPTAFPETSPRRSAAPGSYILKYRLHGRGVPFTQREVTGSLRRSKDVPAKMQSLSGP